MTDPVARPVRALVIGAGPASAAFHLPVLARLQAAGELELDLVCDLQRERAADARRRFGFREESGDAVAALMRTDVDAVYLFASAQIHHEYGIEALRRGKHLFVEKPIAPSYLQAMELVRTARLSGRIAVGGHNRRFYQSLDRVRARAGQAGWRFAEATFHKSEFDKPVQFGARTWLGANGIHALDALVFVMGGLPEHLTALADNAGSRAPAAFSAIMRWPNGSQGTFLCNNNAGARREQYVFHAPGETCSVTDTELIVEKGGTVERSPIQSIGDGIDAEHRAFLQAIRSKSEPRHALAALAPSLFLAELIETGFSGPVSCPTDTVVDTPRANRSNVDAILVAQPAALQPALARLSAGFSLVALEDVRDSIGPRNDIRAAILGPGAPPLAMDILDKLPRLAIVGVAALSLARYGADALLARGIAVVNASAAYADSVAEFALGLAILARRRAFTSHDLMRAGGWGVARGPKGLRSLMRKIARSGLPAIRAAGLEPFARRIWSGIPGSTAHDSPRANEARELRGATVGLIGWSANGRALGERLARAGARILVFSEHATQDEVSTIGATLVSLGDVLAADIVSLHRGLTPRTLHFLGAADLARLRPGAILINVARGALIDPQALLARLQKGDVFACLDSYEDEPLAASHPLRELPNVFLTAHIAGGSSDMRAAAAEEVANKVAAYLSGAEVERIAPEHLRTMT